MRQPKPALNYRILSGPFQAIASFSAFWSGYTLIIAPGGFRTLLAVQAVDRNNLVGSVILTSVFNLGAVGDSWVVIDSTGF